MNLDFKDKISGLQFENINLETDNLDVVDEIARTGILIHNQLHYKRRKDLESPGISSVWIQLCHPGRKPVLIQALYRQHQRLGREGSKSILHQQKRWDRILTKWEEAAALGLEIITMGDVNLNSLSWNLPDEQKSPQDRLQSKMSNMLQERSTRQRIHPGRISANQSS